MGDLRLSKQRQGALDHTDGRTYLPPIGCRARGCAEVRPEQLIGTIEEVESHETDPKPEETDDPWKQVGERWSEIREELKLRYREVAGDEGPSEEAVRDAFTTLGGAAQRLMESVGDAARDPEMRGQLKDVAASLVAALGRTFEDLGEELKRPRTED